MAAAHDVEALLLQLSQASPGRLTLGPVEASAGALCPSGGGRRDALALGWPELEGILPDGGLPPGVVELTAPRALGGATRMALAAVRAGQARGGHGEHGEHGWCAWVDPEGTLHGPGVVAAGVDLAKFLVVHPPRPMLPRVAVKVVASGAFEVVVIDFDAVPRAEQEAAGEARARSRGTPGRRPWPPEVLVRKLALAAETSGSTVLLLTNAVKPRVLPWPVALRVELSRPRPSDLIVRVAKDKRGRIGAEHTIAFRPLSCAAEEGREARESRPAVV